MNLAARLAVFVFAGLSASAAIRLGVTGAALLSPSEVTGTTTTNFGKTSETTQRVIGWGPAVSVDLPWKLSISAAALYRKIRRDEIGGPAPAFSYQETIIRTSAWEVPLLAHIRPWTTSPARHYVLSLGAGAALRTVGDATFRYSQIERFETQPRVFYRPYDTGAPMQIGATAAAGLRYDFGRASVEPTIRYTRWTSQRWNTSPNQVDAGIAVYFHLRR